MPEKDREDVVVLVIQDPTGAAITVPIEVESTEESDDMPPGVQLSE